MELNIWEVLSPQRLMKCKKLPTKLGREEAADLWGESLSASTITQVMMISEDQVFPRIESRAWGWHKNWWDIIKLCSRER